jgi:hypothetical protein
MRGLVLALLVIASAAAYAQECPKLDPEEQKVKEQQCRAAGGEWSRFGIYAFLCGHFTCAPRTRDGGKPCRNQSDCEFQCISDSTQRIGTEVPGKCAAVRTSFGCHAFVDGGRIVGRICVE